MTRLLLVLFLACAVQAGLAQSTVFLVRHAEKAAPVPADSKDPELSDLGRSRAESLRNALKDAGITAVFATEFRRTQQTAAGVATAAGIATTIVPAHDTAALLAKLKETTGNALVVGHSNTVPEVLKGLGIATPITMDESAYDDLFIVTTSSPPRLIRLHYK